MHSIRRVRRKTFSTFSLKLCPTTLVKENVIRQRVFAKTRRNYSNTTVIHSSSSTTTTTTTTTTTSSSVSSDEVSKFSSMASTWWDPNENPLISMNPTRMNFIIQTLQRNNHLLQQNQLLTNNNNKNDKPSYKPLQGLKALDVGCGGGLLSESLARLGANVTAIDPSEQVANAAYQHSQLDPTIANCIDYKGGVSVEELDHQMNGVDKCSNDSLFDIVCILEVIEHATDPNSLLQSATSLLKKPTIDDTSSRSSNGGMLFISTINRTLKSYGIAIVGGEYVTRKLPIGTHTWNQFKSPQEVSAMVNNYGLMEVDVNGMLLKPPFFDLRWELDKSDVDVNWIGAYSHGN